MARDARSVVRGVAIPAAEDVPNVTPCDPQPF
jgi:hypothetical protein